MNLVQHIGADMPARFYIDGIHISRERFEAVRERAINHGRLECFSTRGRTMPGGRIRRTNYSVATFGE